MTKMQVNIQSRKLIKPSKPTPPHLRTYNISLIDELNESMYLIRILFYPHSDLDYARLEQSLARVLPLFYPLAGRYNKQKHHIDCNDEGADYSIAQVVDRQLDQLISAESEQLNHLLPLHVCAADEPTDPILAIQINKFPCGGVATGVCASHRIFDAASVGIFLTAWSRIATSPNYDDDIIIRPDFDSPLYFPSENLPPIQASRTLDKSLVSKRFVFNKNAIATLRERLTSSNEWKRKNGGDRPPSRALVVSAVLTQALMRVDAKSSSRGSLVAQAMNVRERTVPPVSKHSCGTWVSMTYLELDANERRAMERNFAGMATKMRESIVEGLKDCTRILSDKEFGRWLMVSSYFDAAEKADRKDYKVVWISDWSKFGDYEIDFGFGKPVWVGLGDMPFKDVFILMNTKDNDGIEAWVYLHESNMMFFERDEDLRSLTNNYPFIRSSL
ncbi:hypothetical protein CASFOL_022155 [Castilleja foliolosa]|uniref:Uncharacterized protein n=1 Tax=Castilleja foliolosa TaxID=1961234 RepID=A0ABD3D0N8_9LAMI